MCIQLAHHVAARVLFTASSQEKIHFVGAPTLARNLSIILER